MVYVETELFLNHSMVFLNNRLKSVLIGIKFMNLIVILINIFSAKLVLCCG